MKQTPGKIFLADQMGVLETEKYKRYCTFNYADYFNEHKIPFGNLYILNEERLAGNHSTSIEIVGDSYNILIPIIGEVGVLSMTEQTFVNVEEVLVSYLPAKSLVHITNPYTSDWITFLQIGIKSLNIVNKVAHKIFPFAFGAIENKLKEIVPFDYLNSFL